MSDIRFSSQTARTEKAVATIPQERAISGPAFSTVLVRDDVTVQQLPPSFEYGAETPGPFFQLVTEDKANVGDILRITYRIGMPFFQEWQSKFMVSRLNADSRFELRHVALNEEIRRLVVEVKVIKPFSPALLVPLAIAAVLAGALIWITTLSIERLGTIEIGDTKLKIGPLLVIGGLLVGGMALFRGGRT